MKRFILKYRGLILVVLVLITGVLGYFIKDLKIDSDFLNYLPKNDPDAVLFKKIGQEFGGSYMGIIAIKNHNVFNTRTLKEVESLTDTLEQMPGISSVVSLSNVIDIRNEDGVVTIEPLFDEVPTNKNDLDTLKSYVLSKDMYRGVLVSDNANMTSIIVKFTGDIKEHIDSTLSKDSIIAYYSEYYPSPVFHAKIKGDTAYITTDRMEVVSNIKSLIKGMNIKDNVLFGGLPFMTKDVGDVILHDVIWLGPIAFIVIFIILFLSFKNLNDTVLPLLNVVIAIVWTLGIMSILGYNLTMVSSTIPVVLLAVGSAYTIHVINHIRHAEGSSIKEKIENSLHHVAVPVFFASLTTMIGFISFIFGSYLTMIKEFGIFSALGIGLALIFSLVITPVITSYSSDIRQKITNKTEKEHNGGALAHILDKLGYMVTEMPYYFIGFWIIVAIVFALPIKNIEKNVDLLTYLPKTHPSRQAELEIRKATGGTIPIYVIVEGDILTPKTLEELDDVKQFMKTIPYIKHPQSVADMFKEMNKVMGDGDKLPDSQDKVDNLWFMLQGQDLLEQYISTDNNKALVQGVVTTSDTKKLNEVISDLNNFLASKHYNNMKVSGFPVIYKKLGDSLLTSQESSLVLSILLVFVIVSLLLKSLKNGIAAILPITVTLIILFGFMGMMHIPLDVATVLVGSVSIGIGIDYAIHFSSGLSKNLKTSDYKIATIKTMKVTGKAIIINMLSVMLGFLVLVFAELVPLRYFGMLVAITMIGSTISTLTLMPPILKIERNRNNK